MVQVNNKNMLLLGFIIGFVNALVLCVLAIVLDRTNFIETIEHKIDKTITPKGDIFLPEDETLADKLDEDANK